MTAVKNGQVGSLLNINGVKYTREIQEINMKHSRLGIPLIFGYDVIHGYRTIFPVPLGEACSWDLKLIEHSARVAAEEAAAAGQHWTFAPMVDIARDPRWGRIMEGAGEDTYLGSLIASARVRGFQGDDLADTMTIAACAKHYAAYGAAEGGRDYNTVDISRRTLIETYLPPFKACADANVATFMAAFNEINGIPASANAFLRETLKDKWQYKGMVVSDWNSINELINHGIAANKEEAALMGMRAGIDMDMMGHVYSGTLVKLIKEGKVTEQQIDDAVHRILVLKFKLGLFDDPYKYCNEEREQITLLSSSNREAAREDARHSIVLLKNEKQLLPLKKAPGKIALIGPLGDDKDDILGNWRGTGRPADAVSLLEGLEQAQIPGLKVIPVKGCDIDSEDRSHFHEAVQAAKKADLVLLVLGESAQMSGEAKSRSFLGLPGVQKELFEEIAETGKPIILVLMNGRPLAIPWEVEHAGAVLETWQLGTEAGNAITDVLFGDYNPSGKLVASFPFNTGQVPVYYNHKNTGRPARENAGYTSKYIDAPVKPLFPFGYGLSYTKFDYSNLKMDKTELSGNDSIKASVLVKNSGAYDGEEVVQLFLRDIFASVTRPVMELKGFKKIFLKKGEEKLVEFYITRKMLEFYNIDMKYTSEPGKFTVMIGTSSESYLKTNFVLKD